MHSRAVPERQNESMDILSSELLLSKDFLSFIIEKSLQWLINER
jgi:hypothetical protein